jgi:hypothetical protein
VDGHVVPEYRRFSLDPQLTNFETLHSLISRAFDIKSDFLIQYRFEDPSGQEIFLQLLSDWDLEAAFERFAWIFYRNICSVPIKTFLHVLFLGLPTPVYVWELTPYLWNMLKNGILLTFHWRIVKSFNPKKSAVILRYKQRLWPK